jgi:hypothetical protein
MSMPLVALVVMLMRLPILCEEKEERESSWAKPRVLPPLLSS